MAPVENRFTISDAGSTSSIDTGVRSSRRIRNSPRSVQSASDCSSTRRVYSLKIEYWPDLVACWSLKTVFGLKRCTSPSRRHWYSPPSSMSRCASSSGRDG